MAITVRSTAIGAFASRAEAEQAVCGLLEAAFGLDQVGIVLPDAVAPIAGSAETGSTALWEGAMFRSLIGVEIPDSEVSYYEEALEDSHALVMVRAGDRYPEAMDILNRFGGEYLDEIDPFAINRPDLASLPMIKAVVAKAGRWHTNWFQRRILLCHTRIRHTATLLRCPR